MCHASVDAPTGPMPAFATFQHDEKAITIHNIADGNLLQLAAPSVEGAPDMPLKVRNRQYQVGTIMFAFCAPWNSRFGNRAEIRLSKNDGL